ncbi:MAG: DEAD/DEAH box helicase [Ignavibacteria bacterium]|nr:DEAD/DEAH box helicase [Ignavibacteria bacterium]
MSVEPTLQKGFNELITSKALLRTLDDAGYETPTPIQVQMIPEILEGKDVVGQAQTGTGKTAAFALPLLERINLKLTKPQVLVLTPTRELAIQVAEAFQKYAGRMKGFHVLPIYGGQDYERQFHRLKQGTHVVVGTPGRVMDHMRRGTLKLDMLSCLVLDEADEMLRMGFIDDVEWILEQTPGKHQIALFSATIPQAIRRIAHKYLKDPVSITIKSRTTTVEATRQRFWMVSGFHKLDALTRILEAESFDGVLIFVRTRTATVELSEKLEARGFLSAPLSGDIAQRQRERTIEHLKKGKLNILVATDVAARGLDVDRISHVINYDIPHDTEAYVHRIGRTGRAGRSGEAILFVAPRERRMLHTIEKATKQKIEMMELPSTEIINNQRIARFQQRITDTLAVEELGLFYQIIEQYQQEHNMPALEIAAALAKIVQGETPLLVTNQPRITSYEYEEKPRRKKDFSKRSKEMMKPGEGMGRYRIEVGKRHNTNPSKIVGALTNEGGLESELIGKIKIYDDYSTVDLPDRMPKDVLRNLKKLRVSGQKINISKKTDFAEKTSSKKKRRDKKKHKKN